MLYFVMLLVFVLLIAGPLVASKFIHGLPSIPLELMQPTGLNNNDTTNVVTGSALNGLGGGAAATTSFSLG